MTTVDAIRQTDPTAAGLILVDAEGFDYEVLRGADRTVSLDGPIIFTEVTSDEVDSMNVLLAQWGYIAVELEPSGLWVRDRVIRPVHSFQHLADSTAGALWWNSALLPPSRLSDLAAAAAECSLPSMATVTLRCRRDLAAGRLGSIRGAASLRSGPLIT